MYRYMYDIDLHLESLFFLSHSFFHLIPFKKKKKCKCTITIIKIILQGGPRPSVRNSDRKRGGINN